MNDLERLFRENHDGKQIWKWDHYFEVYDRHLAKSRNQPINVVEIGIYQGGSLRMWRDYFGPQANIYGVDINPACKEFEEPRIHIRIGSQEDPQFLARLQQEVGTIDVLIDDGGHTMRQQRCTFDTLYPLLSPQGTYICEDVGTSYSRSYGGGHRRSGSFIELCKRQIDALNAWHAPKYSALKPSSFTKETFSVCFYNGMVVFERRPIDPPKTSQVGHSTISEAGFAVRPNRLQRLLGWIKS